jgi:lipopolysaccharide transport system permease protein
MVPDKYRSLILMNPLSVLMLSWRDLFMKGTLDPTTVSLSFVYSLVVFAVGYIIFRRLRWRFAEVL